MTRPLLISRALRGRRPTTLSQSGSDQLQEFFGLGFGGESSRSDSQLDSMELARQRIAPMAGGGLRVLKPIGLPAPRHF